MTESGSPITFGLLIVAGLVSVLLAVLAWRGRGHSRNAAGLVVVLLAMSEILLAYAFSFSGALTFEQQVGAIKASYVGWLVAPIALVIYLARLTGRDGWLRPWVKIILGVVPLMFAAVIFGPASNDLFFGGGMDPETFAFPRTSPIYIVFFFWMYALLLASVVITVISAVTSRRLHRYQVALVLIMILLPVAVNSMSFFNVRIFGVGPAILSLVPVIFVAFAIGNFRAFDLRPMTEAESLLASDTGVVVLDTAGRVSAMNASAARLLGPGRSPAAGLQIEEVWAHRPDIVAVLRGAAVGDLVIDSASGEGTLEFQSAPMTGPSGRPSGSLILIRAAATHGYVDA